MSSLLTRAARRGLFACQALFLLYIRVNALVAVAGLLVTLMLVWSLCYLCGGSHTALPHLFYVPIVLAAARFRWAGAAATAVLAGLLAGRALPAYVTSHETQAPGGWLLRMAIFLLIGLIVAGLMRDRSESMGTALQEALLSARLLRGIQAGEIEVFYQPIAGTQDPHIVAVEALARWNHPRRGLMPPAEFIPAAERTGTIRALDQHVLREATRQASRWAEDATPVKVSVNVSATRFAERDLPADVRAALDESGLSPELLQLEITESALIEDVRAAIRQLAELRLLGVGVAIDDFGAGQASLGYVSKLAIDTVKLDRSLVAGLGEGATAGRLVGGILGLFRSLGLHVVAEGVEDAQQFARLTAAGCEMLQGFYIGRPAPVGDTTALLSRSSDARRPAACQPLSAGSDATPEHTLVPPPVPSS